MIVLTLAGDSKRFFEVGFTDVKYKLVYNGKYILESILDYISREKKILIVTNEKFKDESFCNELLGKMGFENFRVVEIQNTKGQLETLINGLLKSKDFYDYEEALTVFNGDTIRKSKLWDGFEGDGYIEVFESEGSHWSFVDKIGKVNRVVEKNRISNFCSSGLYYFKKVSMVLNNYEEYKNTSIQEAELFIAPFYNFLIKKNLNIYSSKLELKSFVFCGTPSEYYNSILSIEKEI